MGLEFFGSVELSQPAEFIERNVENWESERLALSELPHLENNEFEIGETSEWKAEDSEREIVELPQLKEPFAAEHINADKMLDNIKISDVAVEGNDASEKQDVENKYYSTYEERLRQTPREDSDRGEWLGARGESDFTCNDAEVKEILSQYDKESITYEDAIPDFSEVSEATVEIEDMTENRADNFRQCDERCTEQWNKEGHDGRTDWTARDVKEWRQENRYSWHERNDRKTCDLVPTKINDYFGHLGGVSECKKYNAENGGSDFDE